MKRFVLLAALPILFVSCSPKDPNDPQFVVAKGKGIKITRAELDKQTAEKLQQTGIPAAQFPKAQLKLIEPQILDQLINTTIILDAAEKSGVAKDVDKKVDEEYAKISAGKDPVEFQKKLTEAGYTEQSVKAMMKKQILIQSFLESKIPKEVPITDEQAMAFYKEHEDKFKEPEMITAQHIVVLVKKDATPAEKAAKEKIIKDARARIAKGEPFEKVAAEVSEDSSKAQGGMLPPFSKGDMTPPFEKIAFESKVDVLSPVFTSDYGFHVLKVKKHSQPRVVTFDEMKDRIKAKLGEDEKGKEAQAFVEKLRKDADVKTFLPDPKADMPAGAAAPAPGGASNVKMVEPEPAPAPAPAPAKP